jgi:hypothetical protein
MEILSSELTVTWLSGLQVSWIGSVSAEPSEGGYVEPVSRQSRPLLQMTGGSIEVTEVQNMFFNTDCGRKGFFIKPPIERLYVVTAKNLGAATGAEQDFQLTVTVGSVSWDALYVDNITLYANGVEISESDWAEDDGLITLDADTGRTGQTITADYEIKWAVRFVEETLEQTIETADYETIQTVTLREIF